MISTAVGGRVVSCNDEFFAAAENLLNPEPAIWEEHRYTDHGKWMDGWETRRRREPGHDWCVLALGVPGRIETITVDTSYFTGNYPEEFSLEACGVGRDEDLETADWVEILPRTGLEGDSTATFEVPAPNRVTYLRLNIFPDGGVARLRVEGTPIPSRDQVCPTASLVDLVSDLVGGRAIDASNAHYSPPSNLLRRTAPQGMWDGWETKRRRGPGFDWATFELGLAGPVHGFVVDTRFFKGNAPGWVTIHLDDGREWHEVVSRAELRADAENRLDLSRPVPALGVKLEIHPDGGVARFRVLGRADRASAGHKRVNYLNSLFGQEAKRFFHTACAAARWVDIMVAGRPYLDPASVIESATTAFDQLDESDWLDAFSGHPRIGERGDAAANREQAGAVGADAAVLRSLVDVNASYESKFGFIYIVYASGKSAEEMLQIASERLENSREEEIGNAASQQRLITATRLQRMLCQEES